MYSEGGGNDELNRLRVLASRIRYHRPSESKR